MYLSVALALEIPLLLLQFGFHAATTYFCLSGFCLCYVAVDLFVCSPLLSCSKSACLPPEALTVKSWIARIFLLIQLYITLFLNSRNFRHLQLLSGRAALLLGLAWKCL